MATERMSDADEDPGKLNPPDPPLLNKFDCAVANQYVSGKKWTELKEYLRHSSSGYLEDVLSEVLKLEIKAIDFIEQNRYPAAASVFSDEIIPLLKTSNDQSLAEHLFYLHAEVNTSVPLCDKKIAEADVVMQSGAPQKLIPHCKPGSLKFDPDIANVFVLEKNWDGLLGYITQFGSELCDESLKLLAQSENHVIQLIKQEKDTDALSAIQNMMISMGNMLNDPETTKLLLGHLGFLKESMCVFDEDQVEEIFRSKGLNGLKDYVQRFLDNNTHGGVAYRHPLLELILFELQLAEASEQKDLERSEGILKLIDDLKALPEDSKFLPADMHVRIKEVKSQKVFDKNYKEGRMIALLDYMRLYFRKQYRPMLEPEVTFLKFCRKLESGRLKCLACGHTFEKGRSEQSIEDHVTRSSKAKKNKWKLCHALTPCLQDLAEECKAQKSCSNSQKRKRNSKVVSAEKSRETSEAEISGSQSKSMKMSTGTEVSGSKKPSRGIRDLEEVPEDPASLISSIYMKMAEVRKAMKSPDLRGIAVPALSDIRSSILNLQSLILGDSDDSESLDEINVSDSLLVEIGNLEKLAAGIILVDLPEEIVPSISDFIPLVFKLRYSALKITSLDSPPETPTLFHQSANMIKLCIDISNMIADSVVPPTATKELKELEDNVVELLRCLMGRVDVKQVFPLVSSLHDLSTKLYQFAEPNSLRSKLKELHELFSKFLLSYLEKKVALPRLRSPDQ